MRKSINQKLLSILLATTILAYSSPSFAARQSAAGAGIIPIDANGILSGVDMSASGTTGTLTVGTVGGAQTNIFNANNPFVAGLLAVSTGASSQGNIVFNSSSNVYGNIGQTQPAGPFLLNITAGNNNTITNFQGSVFATTLDVLGTGTVNFNSGNTNITATNFAGDGTISLAPNTTLIGALTTTAGANTGTLSLGSNSVLDGAVGGAIGLKSINVVGGSNAAGVSANITGAAEAYSFNLGTNTLNVGGALKIDSPTNSIYTTLASPTVYGHIIPTGAVTLPASLGINVLVPSTAYIPVGTLFNVVQATSGTNGSVVGITVQNPTNPLYKFSATPLAGTLNGLVTIKTDATPLQSVLNPSSPVPNQPIVAPIVPVLIAGPQTPDIVTVLAGVNANSTTASVANAVAQLAPSTPSLSAPLVAFQGTRQFQELWVSRLDNVLCDEVNKPDNSGKIPSSCQAKDQKSGWWLKGFGDAAHQGVNNGYTGYNSNTLGTMVAYDVPLGSILTGKTRAGLGVGYSRSNINGQAYNANTDSNNYQTTAYIGHEQGNWFVYGNASAGLNNYSDTRDIVFTNVNRIASASYNGQNYTAFANAGYHFAVQKFTLTPLASLQYTRLNLDGYTETGAGDINLKVQSQHYDFLESGLGIKAERAFSYNGGIYVPQVHFKWLHELNNPQIANNAAFAVNGSPSFTTQGMSTSNNTLNLGAGVTLLSCECSAKTWALEAVYDHNWRNDGYSDNQGMLKFSGHF